MTKKVVHIITGLNDGGAEAVLYRLCINDNTQKHFVVSMMDAGKYGPLLQQAGLEVYCLNMSQGWVTLRGVWRLWSLLRALKPSIVQTWMYHADLIGGVVARLAGVKSVCWGIRHSNLSHGTVKRSTILVAKICAKLSGIIPVRILCCSEQAALMHQVLGYSAKKFAVIANGYDLQKFNPDMTARVVLRKTLGIDENTALLGMVARFDPQKDHANLICALKHVKKQKPKFCCVLVGTDMVSTNNKLIELLRKFNVLDNVRLLGRRNDIPFIMSGLDIHVLSSLGEAFPNVLAEAMACATPCVTTDVGDAALIVGETGWVVSPGNAEALAAALLESLPALADTPAWTIRKQQARQRIVDNFSLEKMVNAFHNVWNVENRLT
ncbi:MAG: glycosyltransferase [Halothiobacillus sp.]|jgi:glycosyltransferase involved in cell wall biosynthesis|nr:glycosyltransferase [Halothiobacillus sp.]